MLNNTAPGPAALDDIGPPSWCYETRYNGWNAPPDVHVPDYWKQFRAPAPYLHYMLGMLYICLMSIAVIGNAIVMYIFFA